MKQRLSAWPLSIAAALLGMVAQLAEAITGGVVDISEWVSVLHTHAERLRLDELMIGLCLLGVGVVVDLRRLRTTTRRDRLELECRRIERSNQALLNRAVELERRNAVLHEAQARLEQREYLAWEVVTGLRQTLLTPLGGIVGALEIVRQEPLATQPGAGEALARARAEARRVMELVHGLPERAELA
jgi:signal transduction histidine kinase